MPFTYYKRLRRLNALARYYLRPQISVKLYCSLLVSGAFEDRSGKGKEVKAMSCFKFSSSEIFTVVQADLRELLSFSLGQTSLEELKESCVSLEVCIPCKEMRPSGS